jgi:O-antigen biosynthesis protein WbqP
MGDLSFVGPRLNLSNQSDLIEERGKRGVYKLRPGISGLAQIRKIDMSTSQLLAETDAMIIKKISILSYFSYISKTLLGSGFGDRIIKSKSNTTNAQ